MIKPKKVLILENLKANQDIIKEQFLRYNPDCVFVIATDKASFLEKMQWFLYDFISSFVQVNDISAVEAIDILEENLVVIPFVVIVSMADQNNALIDNLKIKADALVLTDSNHDLSALPDILRNITKSRSLQLKQYRVLSNSINKQKLMIEKLKEVLYDIPLFEGKAKIETILLQFANY